MKHISEFYRQGWDACNSGNLILSNPHLEIYKWSEWRQGFLDCQSLWDNPDFDMNPESEVSINYRKNY